MRKGTACPHGQLFFRGASLQPVASKPSHEAIPQISPVHSAQHFTNDQLKHSQPYESQVSHPSSTSRSNQPSVRLLIRNLQKRSLADVPSSICFPGATRHLPRAHGAWLEPGRPLRNLLSACVCVCVCVCVKPCFQGFNFKLI